MLHEDSTLTWYNERGDSSPEGGIYLKDAPEMIAAGQVGFFCPIFDSTLLGCVPLIFLKRKQMCVLSKK